MSKPFDDGFNFGPSASFGAVPPRPHGQPFPILDHVEGPQQPDYGTVDEPSVVTRARASEDYKALRDVLDEALLQAAIGKGKERHAKGLPFQEQRMLAISHILGSERGMAYQACKKVIEGLDLPTTERQVAELLGAINYIAGIVIFLREWGQVGGPPTGAPRDEA